jgi:sodium pump decarboxylase gamma subunit
VENLGFGLQLTAVGMGLVFALLGLLWLVLTVLGRLDRPAPAAPEAAEGIAPAAVAVAGDGAADLDAEALAAIAIAVATHAAARRRQAAPEMRSNRPGSQLHASRWVGTGRAKQTREWTPRR